MSINSTHQACHHPVRDVTIVALVSGVVSLGTAVTTMAFDVSPLTTLTSSGGTFIAVLSAGMNVLHHVKRDV
ncbi:hypothetical protein [Streptomyces griseoloalbus]|uniref:Uncharacterized protein n=1 Tax=Streptomyces griseoloalbus TaxID=67303 RepID=A0A7W8BP29_9ACTN|nr:hypothetical protein [Streptomyces albaduncus]MBB5126372.1 hypothetical protein [Streptomyces albaduncus]GGW35462.1 hypothetical protein GCM10010340_11390 [Streptomyces albaduncus]